MIFVQVEGGFNEQKGNKYDYVMGVERRPNQNPTSGVFLQFSHTMVVLRTSKAVRFDFQ